MYANVKKPQPPPPLNLKSTSVPSAAAAAAANDDDDDAFDISDSELIRASQVVESQLKFTNNVHHTTSNAMNIFSQFNSTVVLPATQQQQQHNMHAAPTSLYVSSGGGGGGGGLDPYALVEDLRGELKQVKTECMQKAGEVCRLFVSLSLSALTR